MLNQLSCNLMILKLELLIDTFDDAKLAVKEQSTR